MIWTPIKKSSTHSTIIPHLQNYEQACKAFCWEAARAEFAGLPQGRGLNIAHEAVDRHATGTAGRHVALRWLGADGRRKSISYNQLKEDSSRFAQVLEALGVRKGETVFALTPRIPLLFTVIMGALKHLNIFCPLFATFGPEPVRQRLSQGKAALLVTTAAHYRNKVAAYRRELPDLRHILLADVEDHTGESVWSLPRLLREAAAGWTIPPTSPEDPALLHFTSGTTSLPKGALHVHEAAVMHQASSKYALDLHDGDVFWCTADPGWVTGTSYTIIAPLLHGVTTLVDEADFDARRWLENLADEKVCVLYTSPSAIRRLMRIDESFFAGYQFPHLRTIHSVGEPLDPEAVLWGQRVFGCPIHDTWWQTETGGIMIANFPTMSIKPGSMGRPLPGITAAILNPKTGGAEGVNTTGMLALKTGWPSMFRQYIHDEQRYRNCFIGDWYLTGDLAKRDSDGYFWFCGRVDDIIKTAGHMVGPFEVEAVLDAHPAVAEAAVFGSPDPMLGEIVKACIILQTGFAPSEQLQHELLGFARKRLGPAVAPRHIDFVRQLPRNRAGKVMRRLLKARELGQPAGDLSTLEDALFPSDVCGQQQRQGGGTP